MDELKFKSHAEKEFWEKIYSDVVVGTLSPEEAANSADAAVKARRLRMSNLASKVRAA